MDMEDILQDIPVEELFELQIALKERVGECAVHFINCVKNAQNWLVKYPENSFVSAMAPHGNWRTHLTFVLDIEMPSHHLVFVFSWDLSNKELSSALIETQRIDWTGSFYFAAFSDFNEAAVQDAIKAKSLTVKSWGYSNIFWISKEDAREFQYSVPTNMYLAPLSRADARTIDTHWPHRYDGSINYITAAIERNDNVGLYMEDGTLVAWVLHSRLGALGSLQTLPKHERKGYASIVIKALSRKIAADGWDVYGDVVDENVRSRKLFSRLGFKELPNIIHYVNVHGK